MKVITETIDCTPQEYAELLCELAHENVKKPDTTAGDFIAEFLAEYGKVNV